MFKLYEGTILYPFFVTFSLNVRILCITKTQNQMKNLILLFLCALISTYVMAQKVEKNLVTNKYEGSGVIIIDSMTKEQLFDKTLFWITNVKHDYHRKKTEIISSTGNNIVVNTYFCPKNFWAAANYVNLRIGFKLTLDFKDNKFRYTYTDFYYDNVGEGKVFFDSPTKRFENYNVKARDNMINISKNHITNSMIELVNFLNLKYDEKEVVEW